MPRGRPRTGSVTKHGDHYDIRITYPDGTRSGFDCQPPGMSEAKAREKAKRLTELAAQRPPPDREAPAPRPQPLPEGEPGETVAKWVDRWIDERKRRGLTSAHDDDGRLKKWVFPSIGNRCVATVTAEHLEQLVEELDEHVRADDCSWKTAKNTWGAVSKMFGDACRSKARALRVRRDNPAEHVRGPDVGTVKAQAYLYPSEFLALVSCERVPIRWRRLFTAAVYTYARAAELEALGPEDVDVERKLLHIHRGIDRSEKSRGSRKETKTNSPRRVPIEANAVELMRLLRAEAKGERLLAMPPICDLSTRLRQYLRWAGVTRAELFTDDATRKQITFHDLRATGITWMAIRGDEAMRIMQRAGHKDIATTMIYVREAAAIREGFGEVFPPLPADLLSAGLSAEGPATWAKLREDQWKQASPAGFEPPVDAQIDQDHAGVAQKWGPDTCATEVDKCAEDRRPDDSPTKLPAVVIPFLRPPLGDPRRHFADHWTLLMVAAEERQRAA